MLTVGIGEYAITRDVKESIITHALGSCVAFMVHNPFTKTTALAHIVLPIQGGKKKDAYLNQKPAYFADIIVPQILEFYLHEDECAKDNLQIHLAGGAEAIDKNDVFKVGLRNQKMILDILNGYRIKPACLEVGGNKSRTVKIGVNSGHVTVKSYKMIL